MAGKQLTHSLTRVLRSLLHPWLIVLSLQTGCTHLRCTRCLFPGASTFTTFSPVTNPHEFSADGVTFLGTSGQNVDDVWKCASSSHLPMAWQINFAMCCSHNRLCPLPDLCLTMLAI